MFTIPWPVQWSISRGAAFSISAKSTGAWWPAVPKANAVLARSCALNAASPRVTAVSAMKSKSFGAERRTDE